MGGGAKEVDLGEGNGLLVLDLVLLEYSIKL
jgi:hypothetical protein